MPVVKAKQAQIHHQSAIVMDLADIERQAAKIVADAKIEAVKTMETARRNAAADALGIKEQARKAGHDEGFAAGEAKGYQAGHDEAFQKVGQALVELGQRWSQTLDVIEQNLPTHVAEAKVDLIKLALAIATRVTRQEAVRNLKVAEATVTEALSLAGSGRAVSLLVHPEEKAAIEKYLPSLLEKLRTITSVEIKTAEGIAQGGCEVHFGSGAVDARIDTQLDRIAAELLSGGTEVQKDPKDQKDQKAS